MFRQTAGPSLNHARKCSHPDETASRLYKSFQKIHCGLKQGQNPGHHHCVIPADAHPQHFVVNRCIFPQDDLISKIKIPVGSQQHVCQPVILLTQAVQIRNMAVQPSHIHLYVVQILLRAAFTHGPQRGNGMKYQNMPYHLPRGDTCGQAGKICFHQMVVLPPGCLVVKHRRIIPFPASCDGILGQMLAPSGHSHYKLPVSQPLLTLEGELPPRTAISL